MLYRLHDDHVAALLDEVRNHRDHAALGWTAPARANAPAHDAPRPRSSARHGHGHSHGLVDPAVKRSREGLVAVGWSLLVLGLTAVAQTVVFVASGSIALLADLIHNFGDAATAIPSAIAFVLRSARAERWAGLAVVLAIFVSAASPATSRSCG